MYWLVNQQEKGDIYLNINLSSSTVVDSFFNQKF